MFAAGMLGAPPCANSQPVQKPKRIGYLALDDKPDEQHELFLRSLRELGWAEGKNMAISYRWAERKVERLPAMAEALVAAKVDLIVVWGTVAALAAKKATQSIPIVMVRVADPVGSGIVTSLARPGGNITGMSGIAPELMGKRLEMLKEIAPGLTRVAFLAHGGDPAHKLFLKEAQHAGRILGLQIQPLVIQSIEEIDSAFKTMTREQAGALVVQPIFVSSLGQGPRIAELAVRNRLPSISDGYRFADIGGLMYFGRDQNIQYRRAAALVDRILNGAKPADLPIEQPTHFPLIINMKTAKTLRLTIPQTILVRAERVIE